MAATIKDIAKMTGLGLATISSYLNGGSVREQNRIKIEEAIDTLHFEVNEVARGLKTNKTKSVGIVIPELNNVFCAEIISEIEDLLRNQGYMSIVIDCRTDKKREKEAVEFLLHRRVDGIINIPVGKGEHLLPVIKTNRPVVAIDRKLTGITCDSVVVDNRGAADHATKALLEKGHKKIGIICGPDDIYTARERLQGYIDALLAAGLEVEDSLIVHGGYTIEGGVECVKELLSRRPDMTAVLVSNYEMTMGAVTGCNEMKVAIPKMLSMVGFDNVEFACACNPNLTIVTQPTKEIARQAVACILHRLEPGEWSKQVGIGEEVLTVLEEEQGLQIIMKTKMVKGKSIRKNK